MCGIWALINLVKNKEKLNVADLFQDFYNLKHRGPDNSYFETYNNVFIGFHRLAITDDSFTSNQPFILEDDNRTIVFICNGEIYNYKEIIEDHGLDNKIKSDCAVIPEMYMTLAQTGDTRDFGKFIKEDVKGEFAFMLFEFDRMRNLKKMIVGRDEIGIRPLYYSVYNDYDPSGMYDPSLGKNDALLFTSELKGAMSYKGKMREFPPANIFTYTFDELGNIDISHYNFRSIEHYVPRSINDTTMLRMVQASVLNSVRRRLSTDKPFAFLLSGGIDSSLVAALGAKILGRPIRTFCCGFQDEGTDLKYARMVANHIGSSHTEVHFTPQEGLDAIPDVIRTIESWDTTTVRASVGQYLVSKWIGQNTDCRVVMVGEGPDEVCSSYLFNWYAPDGFELEKCAIEYVRNIHYYDVKRADRCIARWGLEGRVPLLDPEFIHTYWRIPGEMRMPTYKKMEKWWLREAFNGCGLLPDEVLWRRKEAFSDGISGEKSWFQIIQDWVSDKVSDEEMAGAKRKYPYCTPVTKEAYYYRKLFCDIFGESRQEILPDYWQPKWTADGKEVSGYVDPSARVLDIYKTD